MILQDAVSTAEAVYWRQMTDGDLSRLSIWKRDHDLFKGSTVVFTVRN
jgi:hypothetical protein